MELTWPLFLFWLKKLTSALVLPPLLPFVLLFVGLIFIKRRWRGGYLLAWLGFAIGLASISPPVVNGMLAPLEPAAPLQLASAADAQAIVILGGGRTANAPEYGGDTVNRYTLERLRYGARLARSTSLPILVSGGAPGGGIAEARLMKTTLEEDFNVAVKWVEDKSLDTRQNARYSAERLRAININHIILVTHAAHMERAQQEFEAEGIQVAAAPTAWMSRRNDDVLPALPSSGSAAAGWYALHEWVGLLAYRLSK
ncbi:hypothetical protein AGMMS49960_12870 [Betaproteobacteria bacterium]|nr:hypothetical protein AGMMS49960_12870 [Betaproteobacteria bacterium]GHU17376.1 hypothetical protein AGMMS50243_05480 [Betaproteobacteria bacterium]